MNSTSAQSFKNGEVHDWYKIVLGYSDHLVARLIDDFEIAAGEAVLDPFCGSGTTAVECLKKGIDCWGIDANPSSCFAAKVKTSWKFPRTDLLPMARKVVSVAKKLRSDTESLKADRTCLYLKSSGMLDRKWIGFKKLYDIIALKKSILQTVKDTSIRDILLLATVNELVHKASNMRFGPEIYCGSPRRDINLYTSFLEKVNLMDSDLATAENCPAASAHIKRLDSRFLSAKSVGSPKTGFRAVICSPPYPTEHDYTRNARLELAFFEDVLDRESLRIIKKGMIRSHTKGIYSTDNDSLFVKDNLGLKKLAKRIDKKAESKNYGFARLYSKVLTEYFGGMKLHFESVFPLLAPGAKCAYVVGDQSSYFQVPIKTAFHLSKIAASTGFKVVKIENWRRRWASASSKFIHERILILEKP